MVIVAIWVLCLIPIPETPLSHVSLIDKWTHLVMYAGLSLVIMAEMNKKKVIHFFIKTTDKRTKAITTKKVMALAAVVMPMLMGGAIELVQAYCTGGRRSGEWLDFVADSLGVVIGAAIGMLVAAFRATRQRGE